MDVHYFKLRHVHNGHARPGPLKSPCTIWHNRPVLACCTFSLSSADARPDTFLVEHALSRASRDLSLHQADWPQAITLIVEGLKGAPAFDDQRVGSLLMDPLLRGRMPDDRAVYSCNPLLNDNRKPSLCIRCENGHPRILQGRRCCKVVVVRLVWPAFNLPMRFACAASI